MLTVSLRRCVRDTVVVGGETKALQDVPERKSCSRGRYFELRLLRACSWTSPWTAELICMA